MKRLVFILLVIPNISFSLTYKEWSSNGLNFENSIKNTSSDINYEEKQKTAAYKDKNIYFSRQTYKGIPVENSFLKQIESKNFVNTFQSLTETEISQSGLVNTSNESSKTIDANASLKTYSEEFSGAEIINTEQTIIKVDSDRFKIVHIVNFFDKKGEPFQALIDHNNKIMSVNRAGSHFSSFNTKVYTAGPKFSLLSEQQLFAKDAIPKLSNTLASVGSESNKKIDQLQETMSFDTKDDRFDQMQVFYYLNTAIDWMNSRLQITLNRPLEAVVHIGYPEKTNSAFYFQNRIRLGKGDDVTYSNIPHDASIVYHETFHALVDSTARLPFEGEGGSLNEAFADFFTASLTARPFLAESSYLKADFKRNLNVVTKLNEKNGGLYHDSLIFSGLFWEISEKLGNKISLDIAVETLIQLTPYSNFLDFNKRFISTSKKQLSSEHFSQVQLILKNRGFAYE